MTSKNESAAVFIVLVNYGTWRDTAECLASIEDHSGEKVHVIIADIEDIGDSRANLKLAIQKFSKNDYTILELDTNKGFANACNKAMMKAVERGPNCYIWLLNNDTIIEKNSLTELQNCYCKLKDDAATNLGFIGSLILDYYDRDKIQFAGGLINLRFASIIIPDENTSLSAFGIMGDIPTQWIIGASMFFHAGILQKTGYMPEDYFLYYEDIEWSITASRRDLQHYVCTSSVVFHKQGSSTGQDYHGGKRLNPFTARYYYSNYIRFFRKNFPEKLPVARLMLTKQLIGQLARLHLKHSLVIARALFQS